jgi:signal transduction histidine kinase
MDTWIIIEVLVNLLQNYIIYKVLELFYKRRFSFSLSVEFVIIIMTLILTLLNYNFQVQANPLLYLAYCLLILLTTVIIFKGNIFSKAVIIFLLIAVTGTLEFLSAALVTTISGLDLRTIQEKSYVRLEVMIISQTFFVYFYVLIKKRFDKDRINFFNNKYNILVGIILILTVIIMIILAWMYGNIDVINESIGKTLLMLTLCVSLLSIHSLVLIDQVLKDMEEKYKNEMELQQIKLERVYLEDVNSALEEIRIIRHDMRGELALIHGYNELNQKDKIRAHIEKKLQEMEVQLIPQIDSENILTSFLNFKIKEAKSKNINVELTSNINDEEIYIDKGDICRIINNIMNNAIEALQECDTKRMKLFIGIAGGYLIIKSENPYKGRLLTEGKKIITIKKDKTKHGYGLKSINNIAEKYNGFMSILYEDNKFKIGVEMLNNKMYKNAATE